MRRILQTAWLMLAWLLLAAAGSAAGETAADFVDPRVTPRAFDALVRTLDVEPDQRDILRLLYDDYLVRLGSLEERIDRAAEAAGRSIVEQALSGEARVPVDELRARRLAVLDAHAEAGPAADELLLGLLRDVETLLGDEPGPRWDEARRDLHRALYLEPRREGRRSQTYVGDGLDLRRLMTLAADDDPALAAAVDPATETGAAVARLLDEYEASLDELIVETYPDFRWCRIEQRRARITRDAEVAAREQAARLRIWRPLYELNERTGAAIAAAIEPAPGGAEAARAWRDRLQRATFPWLYEPELPDRQHRWLESQELAPAQRERVDRLYEAYRRERATLSDRAATLVVRFRVEFETIFHSMMSPVDVRDRRRRELYDEILRNSGRIEALVAGTARQIEQAVDEALRRRLRHAVGPA